MYPFLKPGDRLIVRPVSPDSFKVGDLAVLRNNGNHLVVHRLIEILPAGAGIFKGDSMPSCDPEPVNRADIHGKVDAVIRGNRFIPVSIGPRSKMNSFYALLSRKGLTPGTLRLKAKNLLINLLPGDHSPHTDYEMRFILSVLGSREPDTNSPVNFNKVRKIACREGVAGIIYHRIKLKGTPEPLISILEEQYRFTAFQNNININALENIEQALKGDKIEIITLKGASLLDTIYPGIGMRPMGDIDLMVRPEDLKQFKKILSALGYKRNASIPHIFRKDAVVIDLHIHALNTDRIISRARLFPSGMKPVWENSIPWKEGFRWLRKPDDIDNLLLLSQHAMKHSFAKLIWVQDMYELLQDRDPAFWHRLAQRVDFLDQRRMLSYSLGIISKLFKYEPPEGSGFEKPYKLLSRIERGLLEAMLIKHPVNHIGPLMALFCISGLMDRIKFGWETLFPRNEIIDQEFSYPHEGRRIFFYPARLFSTIFTLFRQFHEVLNAFIRGWQ